MLLDLSWYRTLGNTEFRKSFSLVTVKKGLDAPERLDGGILSAMVVLVVVVCERVSPIDVRK